MLLEPPIITESSPLPIVFVSPPAIKLLLPVPMVLSIPPPLNERSPLTELLTPKEKVLSSDEVQFSPKAIASSPEAVDPFD